MGQQTEKISLSRAPSMEWKWRNGLIPWSEDVKCKECEGEADNLHYYQVNTEVSDGEYLMNVIFDCDCGERVGAQVKIDKRRYSYFQMKHGGLADADEIRQHI